MKEAVKSFLNMLEEVTISGRTNISQEYRIGVKDTISHARVWFESNNIVEFEIKDIK